MASSSTLDTVEAQIAVYGLIHVKNTGRESGGRKESVRLIYTRSADTGSSLAFDTGGIRTEKPSLCVSFFIPKNLSSKSPFSWNFTLSVENTSRSSTPFLQFMAFGAMSDGRSMNANAKSVITFKRRRLIGNASLSGQLRNRSLKGSLGRIFTCVLGTSV